MATGTYHSLLPTKVIAGLEKLGSFGLDSVRAEIRNWIRLSAGPSGYWFDLTIDGTISPVTFDISVADKVGIQTGRYGVTGNGRIVVTNDDGASSGRYPFPNAAATTYYVYVRTEQIPILVERSTDGQYKATREVEALGFLAAPTSVTDNGNGTITFNVNSVCQGLSASGRKARVWKRTYLTDVSSVAFEELTVSYSGGNNTVTTAKKFGQSTVSTTAADYYVMLIGPVIRTSTYSNNDSILVGTVVGGGTGLVPASNSTSLQPVWHVWQSAISKILRYDSHGEPKVRVLVDASDTEEPQIEVYNPTVGAATFGVDEDGDVKVGRNGGGTTRTLTFYTDSAKTMTFEAADGDLNITSHSTTGIVTIDGVPVAAPDGNGNRELQASVPAESDGGGGSVPTIVTAINSLSAADDLEAGGAIDFTYGAVATTDPVPTITGVGGATVTVGEFAYRARGGLGWNPQQVLTPSNGTTYLYVGIGVDGGAKQGTELVLSSSLALTHASYRGCYLLAKVVKSAGVISSITRLARPYRMLNTNRDITVGPYSAGGDFETLKEAVDYVNNVTTCLGSSDVRRWTIRVIGNTIEADPVVISASGVTIVGPSPREIDQAIYVTWTHVGNCIEIASASDVTIRDLGLFYDNVADGGAGIALTHPLLSYNMTVEGVQVGSLGSGGNPLYGINLGTADDLSYLRIRNCHLVVDQYGILRSAGDEIQHCWIEDNFISDNGAYIASAIAIVSDVQGTAITIAGNRFSGFKDGVVLSKTQAFVVNNYGENFRRYGVQVIYSESAGTLVDGNYVHGDGGSESTSYGILVGSPRCRVVNNDAKGSSGATTKYGIRVEATGTDYCILTSNQTNGQTLSNGNVANTTTGANRDDA